MLIIVILVIAMLCYLVCNVRIVPQEHCYIVERLGVYHTTWEAGLHVLTPFIESVAMRISKKEQVLDFPPQNVITKDNVTMKIDSVVYAKVFDPKKYAYGVENPMMGLQNLTATTLRSVIGDMDLDATLSSRDQINSKMQKILDEATDEWGIKVTRVEIKNIQPPKEIEEVMTKQMRAERERRQTVLEAQAHKESVVARAQGDKEAKILAAEAERDSQIALAEGRAKAIQRVYEAEALGLKSLQAQGLNPEIMVRLKSIDAMKDISDGQATKVFIPNDIASALSAFGVAGEMIGTAKSNEKAVPREEFRHKEIKKKVKQAVEEDVCIRPTATKENVITSETNGAIQMETRKDVR